MQGIRNHPRGHRGTIITIDGPAGSGKSSTARAVAQRLGYKHLDSGAFYRALTLAAIRREVPVHQWSTLDAAELEDLGVDAEPHDMGFRLTVDGVDVSSAIRDPSVSALVPRMALAPGVRAWLLDHLRRAAEQGNLVTDGRDMGTVVFPDADLKVYLSAEPEERARRRLREQGGGLTEEEVRAEAERLQGRDEIDSGRAVAPLAEAADAVRIDTTRLDFEAQVEAVVKLARERAGG